MPSDDDPRSSGRARFRKKLQTYLDLVETSGEDAAFEAALEGYPERQKAEIGALIDHEELATGLSRAVAMLAAMGIEMDIVDVSKYLLPLIHFGTGTAGPLETMHEAGADVLGVDWRVDLDAAWARVGDGVPMQGNLDPLALLAPWPELERRIDAVLAQAAGRPGHIFNLGHGILPQTPVDNVRRLVDHVHAAGERLEQAA
jgi:hypothetical protein